MIYGWFTSIKLLFVLEYLAADILPQIFMVEKRFVGNFTSTPSYFPCVTPTFLSENSLNLGFLGHMWTLL